MFAKPQLLNAKSFRILKSPAILVAMSSGEPTTTAASEQSAKLAFAISLLRSKILQKNQTHPNSIPESDALRWKRKAVERKQEILRLREDLKEAEDDSQCDLFPQSASCKCYFFDKFGQLSSKDLVDGTGDGRFNDVLRRRFLRQVRLKERKRRNTGRNLRRTFSALVRNADLDYKDETEQLKASVDFLVQLCETVSPVESSSIKQWSHQAVDFILASLKNLLSTGKDLDKVEGTVSSLITRLVGQMCSPSKDSESFQNDNHDEFCVPHVIRKLGNEAYIGHRVILLVSQRISILIETLVSLDPFDKQFLSLHEYLFLMIQLVEFLISDNLATWSADEGFDQRLFEEWMISVVHARKASQVMENRNGLYVMYMDRVTGEVAKQVSQIPTLHKFNSYIQESLFS